MEGLISTIFKEYLKPISYTSILLKIFAPHVFNIVFYLLTGGEYSDISNDDYTVEQDESFSF